ncbi:MAG: helix-turn-helix domain-containing protein [Carnobacterium sp.]|uniref:Helix-turn-helix domain-containing protein n=1 Tax=Carnobacterium antarcticum TaxID=2126436 RepID=A0ABW4NQC1_9LACT|nr:MULTISPECIES: helix-turn-helix domain-containing protein [unclassified Carnobacterium]ALV21300.1 DNA binding domain, excisionase [Carnobacterium sp. CP1]QQP69322.1 excisionase family DNA-binding protein [Carnobacterium sp. CS13]
MYLTLEETAEYLDLTISEVYRLVREKQIRTVSDGENLLVNKEQFNLYFKALEKYKAELQDYLNETLPEDSDIKDED